MSDIGWKVCPRCTEKGIEWIGEKYWDCPHCGYRLYFNVAAATAVFLEYRGQLLVLRRNKDPGRGLLDLPGGFVDPGESAEAGLRREIQEELGISISSMSYLFSQPNRYRYKEVEYRTCDLFFRASIDVLPHSFQQEEIAELCLVDPHSLVLEDFAFSSVREAVKGYQNLRMNNSLISLVSPSLDDYTSLKRLFTGRRMSMSSLPRVAYFCMEYGLSAEFKQYAGGLGILAGDHLKGAGDEKLPLVGIGLLWKQGYTDQHVDSSGHVYDSYSNGQYDQLEDTGVMVNVRIRQRNVKCRVWKTVAWGNAPLYLLDTDVEGNDGGDRWITGQLYGWFGEERIAQEMVLGIGGVRALRALDLECEVYHFNEGHALFAGLELIREKIYEEGAGFHQAWEDTREEIVFTTHTPIVEGNESHPMDRLLYMGANNGLTIEEMTELGGSPFNMTVGGLRLSRISNGVAQLHGETANVMWAHVDKRSEIIAITNGIHKPTWVDSRMPEAAHGKGDLWAIHQENKAALIDFIEQRKGIRLKQDSLLIGFSRRAAPYKRSDFIFTDPEVVEPWLKEGTLQIVFSGKAHPLDDMGKGIVSNLVKMSEKYPESVVFLENYDMTIGAALTRGADVWLNNPRRPKEASGTSGMKAAMNGVLNLSTLDGWWPEVCAHGENGWQFGDGLVPDTEEEQDAHDLKALYSVLKKEVIPMFYSNQDKWRAMMKQSILDTEEAFDVKRMLKEYYNLMYAGSDRSEKNG